VRRWDSRQRQLIQHTTTGAGTMRAPSSPANEGIAGADDHGLRCRPMKCRPMKWRRPGTVGGGAVGAVSENDP
jgi:hypothetical protein